MQFALAEHLHKTVAEIREMDYREFLGWAAWFEMRREKNG